MKNVITRSISGIIYIAIIVGAILGGWQWFALLTLVLTQLAVVEFESVVFSSTDFTAAKVIDAVAATALTLLPIFFFAPNEWNSLGAIVIIACWILICFLARMTCTLFDKNNNPLGRIALSALGIVYVGLPMMCLNAIYMTDVNFNPTLVLLMFVLIWLNDTGAFCFGSTLGKRRLCERLSPKKSWEGFWGGMGCCLIFSVVSYFAFNDGNLPLAFWMLFGPVVSIFATWGDLFESLIKRSMGVKDSGHLIPGHGGILDRIDSLLFCAPATALLLIIFKMFG